MNSKFIINEKQYRRSIKKTKIIGIILLIIGIVFVITSIFLNNTMIIGILATFSYLLIMIGGYLLLISKPKINFNPKSTQKKINKNTKIMDYDEVKIMEDSMK